MHYSIIPNEYIFRQPQECGMSKIETIEIDGLKMEVERMDDKHFKIIRLITTDPGSFLIRKYSPGQIITRVYSLEKP
ncbi:MAG TPA: hypothetical protein GXZ32_05080 [Clostridiales bacterium]|nr:hypothetical protein [Clostridiales bacterium]